MNNELLKEKIRLLEELVALYRTPAYVYGEEYGAITVKDKEAWLNDLNQRIATLTEQINADEQNKPISKMNCKELEEKFGGLIDKWFSEHTKEEIEAILSKYDNMEFAEPVNPDELRSADKILEKHVFFYPDDMVSAEIAVIRKATIAAMEEYATLKVKKALSNTPSGITDEIVRDCMNELLKQTHPMVHVNGYPSEAVPKATILELPALMKIKSMGNTQQKEQPISDEDIITYFNNHSNCYADTNNSTVMPAMTRSAVIDMVKWAIKQNK